MIRLDTLRLTAFIIKQDMTNLENLKTVRAGDLLIRQGEAGKSAYIVEQGRVEIYIEKDGKSQFVGTRGPGTLLGEMALIDDDTRTANVRALEDCKLIEITREDFVRRLNATDPVMQTVMRVLMTRYRDTLFRSEIVRESLGWPPPEEVERNFMQETKTIDGLRLENEFKNALTNGQLSLNYQPIVSLVDGQILGFEALMRWNHPEKGFISPGVFIPMAEETGLIIEASKWALKEACRALKRLESHVGQNPNLYMSVNFSAKDFAEESFLEDLYQIISESDVRPTQIQLEITEGLLMSQPQNAKETLDLCRKAGLKIAIDDFGTGYSSLSYLHTYPINTLKIDQSFVRDMLKNKASMELAKSIITLGQNLSMTITAEGVEHKEEAIVLRDLGCESAQGYYFAKPLPEKDVTEMLLIDGGFRGKLA
jgi:EAL domain-containing protein (putative c-di-GMP-specific phosphodiesterase class I)/CRP-like cAMP-binding protein